MDQPQPNPASPWEANPPPGTPAPTSDAPFEPIDGTAPDASEPPPDGDPSSYVDDTDAGDGTRFEPLDGLAGKPKIPFTDDEIIDGTAFVAMLASARATRIEFNDADVETFKRAYKRIFPPFVTTAAVIAPLRLGDALAEYGIHKSMGPGFDLTAVPAWVRIAVGGLLLSTSTILAASAVASEHTDNPKSDSQPKEDPLNTDPPGHQSEPEPDAAPETPPHDGAAAPETGQPPSNGVRPGAAWA